MPKMEIIELEAMLSAERANALAAMSSATLAEDRAKANDYYLGDMSADMPSLDGRSSAVSSDVADTIEGLMPSLMDIFCSSNEVVKFEPVGAEDEAAADQETDYVNHVFMQQNPGFMVLYSFVKDALLSKVGVVKVWWDEREDISEETYLDQRDDQFAMLMKGVLESKDEQKVTEYTERQDKDENGQPYTCHDVTIVTTKKYAQAKVLGVPPEEFGIERGARDIPSCNYCFHEIVTKTESQLIDEGFDEEQIKSLGDYVGNTQVEEWARDSVQEHFTSMGGGSEINKAARLVRVTEHYVRMDYLGNGKAKLYQVTTAGDQGQVLKKAGKPSIIPFDAIPFAAMTPIPITHRFFGRSVADLVMDIQRIKTALLRGMLDNQYLHNNPRVEVSEANAGPNTLDDLLVSRPGGIVRTKTPGGLAWQVVPDITSSIYPALEYMDTVREMRSGVTRQGQGVDANALVNQSATAVAQAFSASQAKMKLIARIFAETGIRDLFSLLHATIRKHGQVAQTIRLSNNWVSVDPREWKTRNDMTIKVGLGDGGKAEQYAKMMGIANIQKELLAGGKSNLVGDKQLYNTVAAIVKLSGHKNADDFVNDPDAKDAQGNLLHPPAAPPPDPKVMAIQAQAANDQAEIRLKAQLDQQKAADAKALAEAKAELDARLKLIEAHIRAVEAERGIAHDQQQHHAKIAETVVGVIADAHKHDMSMAHEQQAHDQKLDLAKQAAANKEPA